MFEHTGEYQNYCGLTGTPDFLDALAEFYTRSVYKNVFLLFISRQELYSNNENTKEPLTILPGSELKLVSNFISKKFFHAETIFNFYMFSKTLVGMFN